MRNKMLTVGAFFSIVFQHPAVFIQKLHRQFNTDIESFQQLGQFLFIYHGVNVCFHK